MQWRVLLVAAVVGSSGCRGDAPRRSPPPPISLWLGGDVHLGAIGPSAIERLAPLEAVIAGATGIVNLEGPVGEPDPPDPGLANGAALLAGLRAAGVAVVGIANNHADDAGAAGRERTLAAAGAAGLVVAGASAGPAVLALGGVRVAITAHDLGAGVPSGLSDELAAAAGASDLLIATFHVTGPPSYLPTPALRQAVEIALAAGARVIAAHGSHALGAVERRGDAVIAWGLGNLLFTCDCTDEVDGAILRIELGARAGADGPRPIAATIVPIDAGLRGAAAHPARDPALIFQLLAGLRSSALQVAPDRATF